MDSEGIEKEICLYTSILNRRGQLYHGKAIGWGETVPWSPIKNFVSVAQRNLYLSRVWKFCNATAMTASANESEVRILHQVSISIRSCS